MIHKTFLSIHIIQTYHHFNDISLLYEELNVIINNENDKVK